MAIRDSYAPGTPCWVDVSTRDTDATSAFYSRLFGWEPRTDPRPEAGGYGMFGLAGQVAAGFGPARAGVDAPPMWIVYMSVADAEATMARVVAHGGTPVLEPVDVFDSGRVALAQDVSGTVFGLWQPATQIGAGVVNDVGAFSWNELASDDLSHARRFYAEVFTWDQQEPLSDTAAIFTVDGQVVCGAHSAGADEPTGWTVWFAVADCDASAKTATDAGGRVVSPPSDMEFGRGAVLSDPQGATFGIAAMAPTDD